MSPRHSVRQLDEAGSRGAAIPLFVRGALRRGLSGRVDHFADVLDGARVTVDRASRQPARASPGRCRRTLVQERRAGQRWRGARPMHDIAVIGAGRIGRIHAAQRHGPSADRGSNMSSIRSPPAADELAGRPGAGVASLDEVLADPSIAGRGRRQLDRHPSRLQHARDRGRQGSLLRKAARSRPCEGAVRGVTLGAANARLFLGFNRRFDPNFQRLHERIRSGEMGALETLHIISHDPAPPPIDYVRVSGGMFKDMTIHDFDMARWLLGEDPVEVYAAAACGRRPGDRRSRRRRYREDSPADRKAARFASSATAAAAATATISGSRPFAPKGLLRAGNVLVIDRREPGAKTAPAATRCRISSSTAMPTPTAPRWPISPTCSSGAEPLVGYRDGIAALAIAEAAMESHSGSRLSSQFNIDRRERPG